MAHFARIKNNIVDQVVAVHNNDAPDEATGNAFCERLFGGEWKQTSYNGNIRKNYAGVGYSYDEQRDAFIPPQPYPSWLLNEGTCLWNCPVIMPTDGKQYAWDEATNSWVEAQPMVVV